MLEYILKNGNTFQRGTVKGVMREVSREMGLKAEENSNPKPPLDGRLDFFPLKFLGALVLVLLLILASVSIQFPSNKDIASKGGPSHAKDHAAGILR